MSKMAANMAVKMAAWAAMWAYNWIIYCYNYKFGVVNRIWGRTLRWNTFPLCHISNFQYGGQDGRHIENIISNMDIDWLLFWLQLHVWCRILLRTLSTFNKFNLWPLLLRSRNTMKHFPILSRAKFPRWRPICRAKWRPKTAIMDISLYKLLAAILQIGNVAKLKCTPSYSLTSKPRNRVIKGWGLWCEF